MLIYVDTETTGIDKKRNEVWQIAAIAETGESFETKCKPLCLRAVNPGALDACDITLNELVKFQHPMKACLEFTDWLTGIKKKYSCSQKFTFAAYNANFDKDFLYKLLKENSLFLFNYFYPYVLECYAIIQAMWATGTISATKLTLGDVAIALDISIGGEKLHDALTDVRLLKKITEKVILPVFKK